MSNHSDKTIDSVELEKSVNRAWAVPNRYENFPDPIVKTFEAHKGWFYDRAFCPIKGCKYEGLVHGFNQHYAKTHAPEQWRQHAKRVINEVEANLKGLFNG